MARSNGHSLEARIGSIIAAAAAEIAAAVRQDMAAQVARLLAGTPVPGARTRPAGAGRASGGTASARKRLGNPGGRGVKRNIPKTCIYPGCDNPSKGPRWSFLCEKHLNTPKPERQKLLATWKASHSGEPASKGNAATGAQPARRGRRPKSAPANA